MAGEPGEGDLGGPPPVDAVQDGIIRDEVPATATENSAQRITGEDVKKAKAEREAAYSELMDDMIASAETQGEFFVKIGEKEAGADHRVLLLKSDKVAPVKVPNWEGTNVTYMDHPSVRKHTYTMIIPEGPREIFTQDNIGRGKEVATTLTKLIEGEFRLRPGSGFFQGVRGGKEQELRLNLERTTGDGRTQGKDMVLDLNVSDDPDHAARYLLDEAGKGYTIGDKDIIGNPINIRRVIEESIEKTEAPNAKALGEEKVGKTVASDTRAFLNTLQPRE